jgi:glutathione synthase
MNHIKVLMVADPLQGFNTYSDSSYLMLQKLAEHQHTIYTCETKHLYMNNDGVFAQAFNTIIHNAQTISEKQAWFTQQTPAQHLSLAEFDCILMRTDPPYNMEYIYATHILTQATNLGVCVMNHPHALREHSEKLTIFNYPEYITKTCVTKDVGVMQEFIRMHGPCILKPLDLMAGFAIFYIDEKATNLKAHIELFTISNQGKPCTLMLQKYIPDIIYGDKRVMIIGDTIVPYTVTRLLDPESDAIRTNLRLNDSHSIEPITPKELEIAQCVQKNMQANNIFFAGLDIIGNYLTEINITSPTGFPSIMRSKKYPVLDIWYQELIKYIQKHKISN